VKPKWRDAAKSVFWSSLLWPLHLDQVNFLKKKTLNSYAGKKKGIYHVLSEKASSSKGLDLSQHL
jgi:hypothetical protein